jgi:versiconal hemiacetal acetate esterase
MGDLDGEDAQVRTISKATGLVIVSVDYRLAPAHPYPAGLDDCITAYYWALENWEILGTKKDEAVTFGTSAGGNLALSTALKVIDEGRGESLKGVVAVVPVTVAPDAVKKEWRDRYTSYEEHAEHTINTAAGMKAFFGELVEIGLEEVADSFADAYKADPFDAYVSPLLHQKLKLLPKVYVAVAEQDTLRDDGRLLKAALDEAGFVVSFLLIWQKH